MSRIETRKSYGEVVPIYFILDNLLDVTMSITITIHNNS